MAEDDVIALPQVAALLAALEGQRQGAALGAEIRALMDAARKPRGMTLKLPAGPDHTVRIDIQPDDGDPEERRSAVGRVCPNCGFKLP